MLQKIRFCIAAVLTAAVLAFSSAGIATAEERPPKIDQDDIIYFLMTDRFNDGDTSNDQGVNKKDMGAYHGGDFQGIIDKLDYIKGLGFTAIWISPVVKNQTRGYHGYWATDFYQTNEHFGSMDKLKELVATAHSKGIKVIFDIVVNHTGQLDPWLSDPNYADWFHPKKTISSYNQEELENGWLAGLPDLNTENPEVRKYLVDMAKWWIKETGIDGYRLDTVRHVPKDFWEEFTKEIKKDYPNFYFIGEAFNGDVNYVGGYQSTGIDGMADFPMYYAITDVFKNYRPATELADLIERSGSYSDRYLMGTFIDNHDVPRFVNQEYKTPEEKLKQALAFMMTYTGIPVMYYGTEIGMDGGADPDNRRDMDFSAQSPITDYVKTLTSIRKSNMALTNGDIKVLKADKNFLSYSRTYEDNTVIVVYNTSNNKQSVEFSIPSEDKGKETMLTDLLGPTEVGTSKEVSINDGVVKMDMEPLEVNVFTYKKAAPGQGMILYGTMGAAAVCIFASSVVILRRRKIKQ